jgi:hypothetical protein
LPLSDRPSSQRASYMPLRIGDETALVIIKKASKA